MTKTPCPACTSPNAYIGANVVECVNKTCRNFSQKWKDENSGPRVFRADELVISVGGTTIKPFRFPTIYMDGI